MRAVVHRRYGPPGDVLELAEIEQPEVADDGALVRVQAVALNPADWYGVTGSPLFSRVMLGFRTPKDPRVGIHFAGTVEAVGKDMTELTPSDQVFGAYGGALAEYLCVRDRVARKPLNLTIEEAASAVTGVTALQGLRDKGELEPGQQVLINGASGGVGTFAVQIAKALGAEVTAVCSTRNVDIARSLGADTVVDYTREDFTRSGTRYDLILDVAGSRSWLEYKRVLKPDAKLVIVGAPKGGRLLGPMGHIARLKLAAIGSSQEAVFFLAKLTQDDLNMLRGLIESGKVKPVIDQTYALSEVKAAFHYLAEGHAQGKVVVKL